jgi:hypothetical protein
MEQDLKPIDHSALRGNQMVIIGLNILAFMLNAPWLAAIVALVMLAGALLGRPGFGVIYQYLLKPLGILRPDILLDHPQPHRFAQGLGGVFMLAGTAALYLGLPGLGWALVWLVAALAALNALAGFCAGCMLYYWLSRWRAPGFVVSPPDNSIPGMRPRRRAE